MMTHHARPVHRVVVLIFLMTCGLLSAQTDRELQYILNRYMQVMGGAASLENIVSVYMTGTVTLPDNRKVPISILKKRPEKLRIVEKYDRLRVIHGYDGKTVWRSLATDLQTKSEVLTGDEARGIILSTPLENALMRPHDLDSRIRIELAGETTIARTPCYRLWVHFEDGSKREYLIETESFLDRKISDFDAEGNLEMEHIPSNFKDFSGVLFAMKQIKKVDGQISSVLELESVEINLGILDCLFAPPADLVE